MQLLGKLILALAFVVRPTHARCPVGRDLRTGVRIDGDRKGHFRCWSHPVGDPEFDGTWQRPERSVQADDAIEGRIYCDGTPHQDGTSVWCVR